MPQTHLEIEAAKEGRYARSVGKSIDDNPYAAPGKRAALGLNGQQSADAYWAWRSGWKAFSRLAPRHIPPHLSPR